MGVVRFDIKSEKSFHLLAALTVAMESCSGPSQYTREATVSHWWIEDNVMSFGDITLSSKAAVALPVPLTREQIVPIIISWLEKVEYGRAPDTDGDTHKGWHLFNAKDYFASFSIKPAWIIYGK